MVTVAALVVVSDDAPAFTHECEPIFEAMLSRRNGVRHLPDHHFHHPSGIRSFAS
jgi:hypothetical protein